VLKALGAEPVGRVGPRHAILWRLPDEVYDSVPISSGASRAARLRLNERHPPVPCIALPWARSVDRIVPTVTGSNVFFARTMQSNSPLPEALVNLLLI